LNGLAIPEMWEFLHQGSSTIYRAVKEEYARITQNCFRSPVFRCSEFLNAIQEVLAVDFSKVDSVRNLNIAAHLQLCNVYYSINNGTLSNLVQIRQYNWLSPEICQAAFELLETFVDSPEQKELQFEKEISFIYPYTCFCAVSRKFQLSGRIDLLSNTLWELKVSRELNVLHRLQVLLYALATSFCYGAYHLLNLRNGALTFFEVTAENQKAVEQIFLRIFQHHYLSLLVRPSDEEFQKRLFADLSTIYIPSEL
jgi:hypothetical protein